jgi:DNA-binding NtrC family response regulator
MPTGDLNVHEVEKELVVRALREVGGSRTAAAKKLGISRRTMHRKLHEFKLEGF